MPESVFTFQNKEYSFAPERDLGISELRHIKAWFGLPMGTYNGLTSAAVMGDPDALACIIWVAQHKAGVKNAREPMSLPDFSVGELVGSFVSEAERDRAVLPPCHLVIDGAEYTLDFQKDLTCKTLRQIKRWYPALGTLVSFTMSVFQGDPDAMACVAWIVWGGPNDKSVATPQTIDFAVGEVLESYDLEIPEEPDEPEPPPLIDPNTGEQKTMDPTLPSGGESSLTAIPMTSGTDTSPKSPTSSTSGRTKQKVDHSSNTPDGPSI
jgi:hypothetical protein